MKIVLAFLSTVFITAFQTYEGAKTKSLKVTILFKINHATNKQRFGCSHSQPLTGLGYPITQTEFLCFHPHTHTHTHTHTHGTFKSEFIASEAGLGYIILKSKWLIRYHLCLCRYYMYYLTFYVFNLLAVFVNKYKLRIIRFATMKYGK